MQVNSVLPNNIARPNRALKVNEPAGDPPHQPEGGDGWSKAGTAGAAVLSAAGLGYLGLQAGIRSGAILGLLLTQPGSGLGDPGLLGNVLTGVRLGAVAGAVVGAAAGVSLVYLISEAMQQGDQ